MPELPEVETIKNVLLPEVKGREITGVELFRDKSVHKIAPTEFCDKLSGQTIENIRRRGKYFLFDLSDGKIMGLHLKMTGVLLVEERTETQKHSIAIFRLDNHSNLHFIDQRKFGSLWLVKNENEIVGKLGPEPLESGFTVTVLKQILLQRKMPVKTLICDQSAIAGIGNMYADEALFAAEIYPMKPANTLSQNEIKRLHKSIIDVLKTGIEHNGASVSNYRLPDGTQGMAHTQFKVAHRRGATCLVCESPITRISLQGRGTYFCPSCQKWESR